MLPLSAKDLLDIPIPDTEVVYRVTVPTMRARNQLSSRIIRAGIAPVSAESLRSHLTSILDRVVTGEDHDRAASILGMLTDPVQADQVCEDDRRFLSLVERLAIKRDTIYRELYADQVEWIQEYEVQKLKLFLRGARNLDIAWHTDEDGLVSDETLAALPTDHLQLVSTEIDQLLTLDRVTQKNSV